MKAAGRQLRIKELLDSREFVDLEFLCRELNASESSIRRDLSILEEAGRLKRVYGGATAIDQRGSDLDFEWQSRRMAEENQRWGAPKIHGELLKLGFVVSERTVARYLRRVRRRGDPAKRWLAFLQNHREVIVALDFFTVPTVTFRLLYCFFVIEHGQRRILRFNVTQHPTPQWVVQQLREILPDAALFRYILLDRNSKFDTEVIAFLKATGLKLKRSSIQAPWQNGVTER